VEFPETSRAINSVEGKADAIAEEIFQLYKRHANEVGEALDSQGKQAFARLRRGELTPDCLLSIAAAGLRHIPGTPTDEHNGSLAIDEANFTITWQKRSLPIGNRKEFHFLAQLWHSREKFVTHADLAERLGGDQLDKVTHIKSRLVKLLKDNGFDDLAGRIKSQRGHYGLFIS
jgi:DNA-binding response OmpR family regulator